MGSRIKWLCISLQQLLENELADQDYPYFMWKVLLFGLSSDVWLMPRVDRCLSLRNFHLGIFSGKVRFIKKNRKGNRKNFQLHTYMSYQRHLAYLRHLVLARHFPLALMLPLHRQCLWSLSAATSCHSQIVHVPLFGPSYRQYYAAFGKIMLCYVINSFLAYRHVFAPAAATLSTIDLSLPLSSSRSFCIC